jgi:hypothetical protein
MRVISQGEAVIRGTCHFNPASGWVGDDMLWWEIEDDETCRLVPLDGVEITHLGNPDFGSVTPQQLMDSTYSSEPIDGSLNGAGRISPGSVIAVRSDRVYGKLRINGLSDACLGVSWVSYFA